jgi:tetratricopeptide (TPR) repeat protein
MRRTAISLVIAIPVLCLLVAFAYNLPPVHDRLAWRLDNLQADIKYALNPPEQVVFVPKDTVTSPTKDLPPPAVTQLPTPTSTATQPGPTATPAPTTTPTLQPTPIPGNVTLTGIIHEYQKWNNCGPANLAMDLSFWKWKGDQRDTAAYMKPNPRDKNVMPYEMVDFVNTQTDLKALFRVGGDLDMLKKLIAAGFPVIVEKGFEGPNFDGWMGHYEVVNAYDDKRARFTVQDSYIMANLPIPYDDMEKNWRAFNYTYVVVYPPDREADVMAILGPQADQTYNYQYAAQKASDEIYTTTGRDQYFAWYNRGSSLVGLQDYAGAANAYDQAFAIYPSIPEKQRPWRMVWYQTGPYFAYFYSGRYYDVLTLATSTIDNASEPAIEESFYWRAMANTALGQTDSAITDYRTSLQWHPGFEPSLYQLNLLGVNP